MGVDESSVEHCCSVLRCSAVHFTFFRNPMEVLFFDIEYMFARVEYNLKRCLIQIHSSHRFRYSLGECMVFLYGCRESIRISFKYIVAQTRKTLFPSRSQYLSREEKKFIPSNNKLIRKLRPFHASVLVYMCNWFARSRRRFSRLFCRTYALIRFFLLAYIRFWVCTNASQCVVVFVSFSNKNIVFYLFYFSSFFGTRSVGQGRNESANIIFWFRLHFCFELHAMIISVLSLWVHSGVCIFFLLSCVPWLYQNSSLYVLCQLSLFVSAHHVYMYLVIYGCACSSRSCVHVLPYIWMMWMYISYEPKQSSNERVENEYANHSQVKSVCKSNLKIILSR